MTLKELLDLEEDVPCPGCPVCKPRVPRVRKSGRYGGQLSTTDNEWDKSDGRKRINKPSRED